MDKNERSAEIDRFVTVALDIIAEGPTFENNELELRDEAHVC